MKFVIGKRYRWSPYKSGKKKWKNGVLSRTYMNEDGETYGVFIIRDGEEWAISFGSDCVEEYFGTKVKGETKWEDVRN